MSDIWSWSNAVDAAGTLVSSASGSAGDLLATNIRDPRVGKIWRAGAMPATLNIHLPAAGAVAVFGVFGCNFRSLGPVTLRLGSSEGAGDLWEQVIDPVALGLRRQAVFVLRNTAGALAPVSASYATITVADGDPLEIGRVWLGTADWQPTFAHSPDGSGWHGEDLSQRSRTPRSGAYLIDRGARLRAFTANYEALQPEDYAGALFEMDDLGLAQQMLFVPASDVYDPHKFAVLGYLSEIPATNWRAHMTAGRAITITEAG